jgi:hypothetical protein
MSIRAHPGPIQHLPMSKLSPFIQNISGKGKDTDEGDDDLAREVEEDETLREIENEKDDEKDDQEPEPRPDEVPEPDSAEHITLQKRNLASHPTGEAFLAARYLASHRGDGDVIAALKEAKETDDGRDENSNSDESSEDEISDDDDEVRKPHTPVNGYDEIDMPDEMKKKDKIPRTPPLNTERKEGDEHILAWTPRQAKNQSGMVSGAERAERKQRGNHSVDLGANQERSNTEHKGDDGDVVEDEQEVAFETKSKVSRTPRTTPRTAEIAVEGKHTN